MSKGSNQQRERLLEALDLMEFGVEVMRQNIRRQLPYASEEEVLKKLQDWIDESPLIQRQKESKI